MDFATFKQTFIEYLPEKAYISIGNDFSANYDLLVDNDGYIHLKKKWSFLRVKTSICIESIEFRKEVPEIQADSFYMINESNALYFDADEEEFYFYENGEPSGWGPAFDHFTQFPFGTPTQHYVLEEGTIVLK